MRTWWSASLTTGSWSPHGIWHGRKSPRNEGHNALERSTISYAAGKINYFDWAMSSIANCKKLPEGIYYIYMYISTCVWIILIDVMYVLSLSYIEDLIQSHQIYAYNLCQHMFMGLLVTLSWLLSISQMYMCRNLMLHWCILIQAMNKLIGLYPSENQHGTAYEFSSRL
jgi:hypothetical protein